eukprot:3262284-Pyramimonas_sp.AAC.1
MKIISRSLQDDATTVMKHVSINCKISKAFKVWVKKDSTSEFLTEYKEVESFTKEQPVIDISLPGSVQIALREMNLKHQLVEAVSVDAPVDVIPILDRFKAISEDNCRALFTSDELLAWQEDSDSGSSDVTWAPRDAVADGAGGERLECIDDCLLTLVAPPNENRLPKHPGDHLKWLSRFLGPVPTSLTSSTAVLDYQLSQSIMEKLVLLKDLFDLASHSSNRDVVNDSI